MAWRVPRFGVIHAMRDAGYSALTIKSGESVASGDYLSYVLDERRETMTFAASDSGHYVAVDTGSPVIVIDRLIIPVGHNLSGADIKVQEDSVVTFDSPATDLKSYAVPDATQIDLDDVTESQLRYLRVRVLDDMNPVFPELWLTTTLAPGQSANPNWKDERFYNILSFVAPSGDRGDLQLGASQRMFELEYPNVWAAADIAMLDQLIDDVGMEKAFIFDPPFDDEDSLICRMYQKPERRFSYPAPKTGTKGYTYRFYIVEQLA